MKDKFIEFLFLNIVKLYSDCLDLCYNVNEALNAIEHKSTRNILF